MRAFLDCPACGCLIDAGESGCPFCGATVRSGGAPVWLLVGLALGVGLADISCVDRSDAGPGDSSTVTVTSAQTEPAETVTAGGSSSGTSSGTTGGDTPTTNDPGSADASTYAGPDATFLGADGSTYAGPDESIDCDAFAQACPDGEKCAAIISDGGSSWDATACVPANGSGQPGDSCIAESVAAGLDDCAKGVMCWDVDDMGMGTCVKLCEGTPEAPICPDQGVCTIANDGALNLCLPSCSPLLQDCPEGNACYPINDGFSCAPDASGDTGVANDPCEFINVCEAGLMCADAAFVGAGCPQGSTGCCTPFCNLSDPAACPNPDQSCVEFYDPLNVPINPPDAKDIGVCGIPM